MPVQQPKPLCEIAQMLKEAMVDEKEAASAYEAIAEKSKNPADRNALLAIRRDEERHYGLLCEIYGEITGREYPAGKVYSEPPHSYLEMIKSSICGELEAAASYEKLACALTCMRHKETVCSILNDEKMHAKKLAAIYQSCGR
ncbi:MAG: hypothetical protein FWD39_00575 [Clostridiales bacterium]|nr:hypothetical protein [Clostridiales bacterium]